MRVQSHDLKVVYRQVEPGSGTEVPFVCVANAGGVPADGPDIVWAMGWGEDALSATVLADTVSQVVQARTWGVVLPFTEIVRKASNLRQALRYLLAEGGGLREVAEQLSPDGELFYAANSSGGPPAINAAAYGRCSGLVTVSPAGLSNEQLGFCPPVRGLRLVFGLAVVTVAQSILELDMRALHTARGGVRDARHMGMRSLGALGFLVSKEIGRDTAGNLRIVNDRHIPAALLAPEHDACFRYSGYETSLGAIGCSGMLVGIKGPHASMAGRVGRSQQSQAARWIRSVIDGPASVETAMPIA